MLAFASVRAFAFMAALLAVSGCSDATRMTGDPCAGFGPTGCTTDASRSYTCANGVYREHECDPDQECSSGQCRATVCMPNLFFCDGNVADVCDATGTQHTRSDCDTLGAKCVVAPLTAMCELLACTPSTTFCAADGSAVKKCSIDGTSSDVVQYCADPDQRGNRCVGSACRDRCTLLEAQDRSTVGCRFLAASASNAATLVIANPQPDLPASITIGNLPGAGTTTRTVAAASTMEITWTPTGAAGTSQSVRAIAVTSTVPVQAWLIEANDGGSLHPEHALSSSYLFGVDAAGAQTVSIIATVDNTSVSVTVTAATSAGGAVPATTAGGTLVRTLQRGEVLTLASASALTGSRVVASSPVAVVASAPSGTLTLPGADALGLDVVVLGPSLVVARDAASVTTELDGTLALAAGASAAVQASQHLHATGPVLVIDAGTGGRDLVPPVEQWRSALFPAWSGASATLLLGAAAPTTVTAGTLSLPLAASASNSFASTNAPVTMTLLLTAPVPFFTLVRPSTGTLSGGYGLASISP